MPVNIVTDNVRRKNMEDISALIREARPLYFSRKRRNNRIKAGLAVIACTMMISLFYPRSYTYGYTDEWSEAIYMTENGSVIEDMGLPVDEYGLLMVA